MKEYFNNPRRGYGAQVVDIFHKLRAQKFEDPFGPAKEQFNGSGSYGNGGAMRVAPLALFCHSSYDKLVDLVRQSAKLTHTHKQGYDGTILQVNLRAHTSFEAKERTEEEERKPNNFELNILKSQKLYSCKPQFRIQGIIWLHLCSAYE